MTYVVVSKHRQQELAALFGCQRDEIKVIYNGVDPQVQLGLSDAGVNLIRRLGFFESDLNLIMPVRVTQAKNIEYAMQVLAALKARGCRPRLVLTGPPDPHDPDNMSYYRALLQMRSELNIDDEFQFVYEYRTDGRSEYNLDLRMVGELFRVSDLLLMPSHREGFGMPVLEAGLAGIPIFCTEIPAAREIGKDSTHLIDPGSDPDETAARIHAWSQSDPAHRLRRHVRANLTWEAIFKQHIEPLFYDDGLQV